MEEHIVSRWFILLFIGIFSMLTAFFAICWSSPRMRELGLWAALWKSWLGTILISIPIIMLGMALAFSDGAVTGTTIFDSWPPKIHSKLMQIWHGISLPALISLAFMCILVLMRRKLGLWRAARRSLPEGLLYALATCIATEFWLWHEIGNWMPYPLHPWLTGGLRDVEGDPKVQLIMASLAFLVAIIIAVLIRRIIGSKLWMNWRSLAMAIVAWLIYYCLTYLLLWNDKPFFGGYQIIG